MVKKLNFKTTQYWHSKVRGADYDVIKKCIENQFGVVYVNVKRLQCKLYIPCAFCCMFDFKIHAKSGKNAKKRQNCKKGKNAKKDTG